MKSANLSTFNLPFASNSKHSLTYLANFFIVFPLSYESFHVIDENTDGDFEIP